MDKPRRYIIQGGVEKEAMFYCPFCEVEFADEEVDDEDICPNCGAEHKLWAYPADEPQKPKRKMQKR